MKYAMIVDGVVDAISMETETGGAWEVVPNDVFAGDTKQSDGSFLAPTPAPEPLAILEPWQFFAALKLTGNADKLETFFTTLPEPIQTVARSKFERSTVFNPTNALVLQAKAGMGLTDTQFLTFWQVGIDLA